MPTTARPRKILILFAHPALHKSKVNKPMIDQLRVMDNITVQDLYETYPDFHIDIGREQDLVEAHDIIVLHHPFFWYSCPPLLKEWIDLTLTLGWAYGPGGTALHGKAMMSVITTGGSAEAYTPHGYNRYTIPQLLAPFDQTAHLCGMTYLKPVVFHSAMKADADMIRDHAQAFRDQMIALRDGSALEPFEPGWTVVKG